MNDIWAFLIATVLTETINLVPQIYEIIRKMESHEKLTNNISKHENEI